MDKAQKKLLRQADEALSNAMVGVLNLDHATDRSMATGDKIWREVCHARKLMELLIKFDEDK